MGYSKKRYTKPNTTKKRANSKSIKRKNNHATIPYVLSRSEDIYDMISNNYTIAEVAKELGVSRSWLFEVFKSTPSLNKIKEDAFAARMETIRSNLFKRASGNYTTTCIRTTTNSIRTTSKTEDGSEIVTESDKVTERVEDVYEHIDDPDIKAIGMLLKFAPAPPEEMPSIDDTITDADAYTFVDVEAAETEKSSD